MANDLTASDLGSQWTVTGMGSSPTEWRQEADGTTNADGNVTREEIQAALNQTSNSLDRIAQGTYFEHDNQLWKDQHKGRLEGQKQYYEQELSKMPPSWTVTGMGSSPTEWHQEADGTMNADGEVNKEEMQAALDQTNDSLDRIAQGNYFEHDNQLWKDQHKGRLEEQKKYYEQELSKMQPSPAPSTEKPGASQITVTPAPDESEEKPGASQSKAAPAPDESEEKPAASQSTAAPAPDESEEKSAASPIQATPAPEPSPAPSDDMLWSVGVLNQNYDLVIGKDGNGQSGGDTVVGLGELINIASGKDDNTLRMQLQQKYPEKPESWIESRLENVKQACNYIVSNPSEFFLIDTALTGPGKRDEQLRPAEIKKIYEDNKDQIDKVRNDHPSGMPSSNEQLTGSPTEATPAPEPNEEESAALLSQAAPASEPSPTPSDDLLWSVDVISKDYELAIGKAGAGQSSGGTIGQLELENIAAGKYDDTLRAQFERKYPQEDSMSDEGYDAFIDDALENFKQACNYIGSNPSEFFLIDTALTGSGEADRQLGVADFNKLRDDNKEQIEQVRNDYLSLPSSNDQTV